MSRLLASPGSRHHAAPQPPTARARRSSGMAAPHCCDEAGDEWVCGFRRSRLPSDDPNATAGAGASNRESHPGINMIGRQHICRFRRVDRRVGMRGGGAGEQASEWTYRDLDRVPDQSQKGSDDCADGSTTDGCRGIRGPSAVRVPRRIGCAARVPIREIDSKGVSPADAYRGLRETCNLRGADRD